MAQTKSAMAPNIFTASGLLSKAQANQRFRFLFFERKNGVLCRPYDISADQLGSDASVGVLVMRSLKPSMPIVTR
jgi:hypothetical protein